MLVTRKSPFSGKENTKDIDVSPAVMERWQRGEDLIQNLMPHLSADDREFIMTGITPEEWKETFSEDEE